MSIETSFQPYQLQRCLFQTDLALHCIAKYHGSKKAIKLARGSITVVDKFIENMVAQGGEYEHKQT